MKRLILALTVLGGVAACGVDGRPSHPEPGVTISGTVEVGITGGS